MTCYLVNKEIYSLSETARDPKKSNNQKCVSKEKDHNGTDKA